MIEGTETPAVDDVIESSTPEVESSPSPVADADPHTPDASPPASSDDDAPPALPSDLSEAPEGTEPPPPPPPDPVPYEPRVMGTKYAAEQLGLTGAKVRHDGTIEFPADTMPRLNQLISKGRMYEETVPKQLHEARQAALAATHTFNEDAERGKAIHQFFSALATKSEQEIYDFVMDFRQQKPLLDAQVERALAQAERAALMRQTSAPTGPANLPPELIEQQAADAAWQASAQLRSEIKGLSQQDASDIADRLWRNRQLYITLADRDYPEYNVVQGQPVFNTARWAQDFEEQAQLVTRAAQTVQQAVKAAPKVQQAALQNAKAVGQTSKKAPPPPPGGATSAGSAPRSPRSKKEYEELMQKKYGGFARTR